MAGPIFVLRVLATFWCFSRLATASVYPTKPTATTIYQAGAPAEVRWTEDNKKPLLNLTGVMQIDLYEGNSVSSTPADKSIGKNYASNLTSCYYPSKNSSMVVSDISGNPCKERGPTVVVHDALHPNIGHSEELPLVVSYISCSTSCGYELRFK